MLVDQDQVQVINSLNSGLIIITMYQPCITNDLLKFNVSIGNYSGGSGFFGDSEQSETSGPSGDTSGESGTDDFFSAEGNTSASGSGSSSGNEQSNFWPK